MTARSSPHHAAVVRAQVRRRAAKRIAAIRRRSQLARQRDFEAWQAQFIPTVSASDLVDPDLAFRIAAGRAAAAKYLRDPPKTEEQKASRWRGIWGGK